jgi:hypothetical protein
VSDKSHRVKDKLLEGAAEAQRRNGLLPNTRLDETIWSDVLRSLDQKDAAKRSAPDRNPARGARAALEKDGAVILEGAELRQAVRAVTRKPTKRSVEATLAIRRLELLKRMPEWQRKVIAAFDEGHRQAARLGARDARLLVWLEVKKVLEASDKLFGRWDRIPEPKATTSG